MLNEGLAYDLNSGDGVRGVDIIECDNCQKTIEEDGFEPTGIYYKHRDLCLDCYLKRYAVKAKCSVCGANNNEEWLYINKGKIYCSKCKPSEKDPKLLCSKCGADNGCGSGEELYEYEGEILCYDCMAKNLGIYPVKFF